MSVAIVSKPAKKLKAISLRLPQAMLEDLRVLAHERDVPYQSPLKVYLVALATPVRTEELTHANIGSQRSHTFLAKLPAPPSLSAPAISTHKGQAAVACCLANAHP